MRRLSLLLFHLACFPSYSADSTFVSGRIENQKARSIVTFFVTDYVFGIQNGYPVQTVANGSFEIRFPLRHTQDVLVSFEDGSTQRLIVSPNDTLRVEFGVHPVFHGRSADACRNIEAFHKTLDLEAYRELEHAYSFGFERFAEIRSAFRKKELEDQAIFCLRNECSPVFSRWFEIDSEVRYIIDITNYGWKGNTERSGKRPSKSIALEYLQNRINLYDTSYRLSSLYGILINNLSWSKIPFGDSVLIEKHFKHKVRTLRKHQSELTQTENAALNSILESCRSEAQIKTVDKEVYWGVLDRYSEEVGVEMSRYSFVMLVEEASRIEDSNLRDLILCKYSYERFEKNSESDFVFQFVSSKISNAEYGNALRDAYLFHKPQADQKVSSETSIVYSVGEKSGEQLMEEITSTNQGKLVVLDFWATWCGPCRTDFQKMTEIKPQLPSEVSFVYLCCESHSQKECQKVIDKYNVEGQHFFVSSKQYADLQKKFQIRGFPTYIVIDKRGGIHKDVITTSNPSLMISSIKSILGL